MPRKDGTPTKLEKALAAAAKETVAKTEDKLKKGPLRDSESLSVDRVNMGEALGNAFLHLRGRKK